MLDFERD